MHMHSMKNCRIVIRIKHGKNRSSYSQFLIFLLSQRFFEMMKIYLLAISLFSIAGCQDYSHYDYPYDYYYGNPYKSRNEFSNKKGDHEKEAHVEDLGDLSNSKQPGERQREVDSLARQAEKIEKAHKDTFKGNKKPKEEQEQKDGIEKAHKDKFKGANKPDDADQKPGEFDKDHKAKFNGNKKPGEEKDDGQESIEATEDQGKDDLQENVEGTEDEGEDHKEKFDGNHKNEEGTENNEASDSAAAVESTEPTEEASETSASGEETEASEEDAVPPIPALNEEATETSSGAEGTNAGSEKLDEDAVPPMAEISESGEGNVNMNIIEEGDATDENETATDEDQVEGVKEGVEIEHIAMSRALSQIGFVLVLVICVISCFMCWWYSGKTREQEEREREEWNEKRLHG